MLSRAKSCFKNFRKFIIRENVKDSFYNVKINNVLKTKKSILCRLLIFYYSFSIVNGLLFATTISNK